MLKEAKIVIEESKLFYDMYYNNCYARTLLNQIQHNNGIISIDAIFALCDIITKKEKQIIDLLQNNVKTQYIVATEETIEKIKKDIEGC